MSNELIAIIGFGISTMGVLYTFMRNFKTDVLCRMDKFDEKLLDIDRRLCRIEGAMSNKDCCMLKNENQGRKAE